ncbi:MAG: alanine racemase [Melioribacteraceae bacterium]|jgi:alanine racemase|nr:alanine racemase [Melioribacteraceae bacterium]
MNELSNQPTISIDEIIRPTHLVINLTTLKENFNKISSFVAPAKVMPILKANAYGHGLVRVAQLMQELNAASLGVAVLEEGILLRQRGITIPILVLGGILGNQIPLFLKHDLSITASSIDKLKQIDEAAGIINIKAKVHLKIDTGMERLGVHYYSAEKFIEASLKYRNVIVEGIYSHFANADKADASYSKLQLERFDEVLSYYDKISLPAPIKHISNSGGIVQLSEANLDLVRPGIMLYGVMPSNEVNNILGVIPALTWKSHVVYFKVIKPNHPVGYGSTWQTDHNVRAVTIPVGYGDGYFRSMSHKAKVLLRGVKYPVVGSISMDQIVVNIESGTAYNNDEVILIGKDGNNLISVEELADWANTIPYEILTNINTRVPRLYTE